jgi:hypothetical protein
MEEFQSKMVQVANGSATMLSPVDFSGRVSEAQLEKWLIENPELAGESLLVLGSQLAEFAEDKDRLDVLAVDRQGEIVLLELKVDGAFRLTDLQALAYAAGYSALPTSHFVEVLRKRWDSEGISGASVEMAREKIVEFVDVLDEFEEWQPSKRVRIKLIAPGYPKRVLHTVKWLGDVYGMPIEAIQVQLYEDDEQRLELTFERLLPLKSEDQFDLTIKVAEERIAGVGKPQRPAILKTLLENGIIKDGQELWLHPSKLPADSKHVWDPKNIAFRVVLDASGGQPRFRWRPTADSPEEVLAPSAAWFPIFQTVLPDKEYIDTGAPVFNHYSVEPEGPTLGEVALEHGVW